MGPNLIIAGVPKAGTGSLHRWLCEHPEADGPAEKETYYLVDPGTHMFRPDRNWRDHGLAGYEALFAGCDPAARVRLEATPGYLYARTALEVIPTLPTRPQVLVVLREPVAQLRSLFTYFGQNWTWIPRGMAFRDFVATVDAGTGSFRGNELAANALENAWYPAHLRRWRDAVGPERLHVLLFEDLVADPRAAMRALAARLGIDPGFYDTYAFPAENQTYAVRIGALQDLNVRLRARLPQGRAYRAARRLYRALNTRPATAIPRDAEVERALSRRFAGMLPDLEAEFGLDLARWRAAFDARLEGPHPRAPALRIGARLGEGPG